MPCFENKIKENLDLNVDDTQMFNFLVNKLPDAAISKHRYVDIDKSNYKFNNYVLVLVEE